MKKKAKAYAGKNPLDAIYEQPIAVFEFVTNYEYRVIVDTIKQTAIVQMPDGTEFNEPFEYYFLNEDPFVEDEEFYGWLKFLLMSFEFYNSETWDKNEKK